VRYVAVLLASVLGGLGLLHLYWAARGVSGASVALPERAGRPVFVPSRPSTLLVACLLLAAAFVALSRGHVLGPALAGSPTYWAAVGLGVVFIARAIGEFRYVGFFKRVRGSRFAACDTWLFSPLSLLIGIAFLLVAGI